MKNQIFIDGAFNLSYAEKLYGHSAEAIAWRKRSEEIRRKRKRSNFNYLHDYYEKTKNI